MVFPTFFNLSLNFKVRSSWPEPMVSSRSCSCWLHRASPSSAAKNIMNLILVLTIWWCPCVQSFTGLLEKGICWLACPLNKTLLAFALLHFVCQGQTCLLFWVSLGFLLLHSNPLWWKGYLFFHASSRSSCRSSQNQSTSAFWASMVGA